MLAEELTGVGAEVRAEVLARARTGELAGELPEVLAGELAEVLGGLRTGGGEEGMQCSR